jgi:hypothetical protein
LTSKTEKNTISVPGKQEEFFQWSEEPRTESRLALTLKLVVNIDELRPNVWMVQRKLSEF